MAAVLALIPWESLIALLIKGANWLIDLQMQKSDDKAATMSALNTHMKGALDEISKAKTASAAAAASAVVDPDGMRDQPSAFNADNQPR